MKYFSGYVEFDRNLQVCRFHLFNKTTGVKKVTNGNQRSPVYGCSIWFYALFSFRFYSFRYEKSLRLSLERQTLVQICVRISRITQIVPDLCLTQILCVMARDSGDIGV